MAEQEQSDNRYKDREDGPDGHPACNPERQCRLCLTGVLSFWGGVEMKQGNCTFYEESSQ